MKRRIRLVGEGRGIAQNHAQARRCATSRYIVAAKVNTTMDRSLPEHGFGSVIRREPASIRESIHKLLHYLQTMTFISHKIELSAE